jgi:hypothetical protein
MNDLVIADLYIVKATLEERKLTRQYKQDNYINNFIGFVRYTFKNNGYIVNGVMSERWLLKICNAMLDEQSIEQILAIR